MKVKRIAFFIICFPAALVFVWVIFTLLKMSAAREHIAAIRSAGDPVCVADLAPPTILPDDNATTYLSKIVQPSHAAVKDMSVILMGSEFDWAGKALPPDKLKTVQQFKVRYADLFDALSNAADCKHCAWDIDYTSLDTVNQTAFDFMGNGRVIASLSNCKIRTLAATGHPDAAAAACLDQLRISRQRSQHTTVLGFLVQVASRGIALRSLNGLLQEAKLSRATHDAIEQELNQHDIQSDYVKSLKAERAYGLDSVNQFGIVATLTNMNGDYLEYMGQVIADAELEFHERPNTAPNPAPPAPGLLASLAPAMDNCHQAMSRQSTRIRCLRIWNQMKKRSVNDPTKPIDLATLGLPDDAIIDPCSGQKLKVKWTPKGWIVYGVGVNAKDDGGGIADDTDVGVGPVSIMP